MKEDIMHSSFIIIKEKKIMVEVLSGVLTLQNMKDHKIMQTHDINFSVENDLLCDLRNAIIKVTIDEVDEYIKYLSSKGNVFGSRKSATLVSTANQLAYSLAFKKFEEMLPQKIKIFNNDFDATLAWLGKSEEKDEISKCIEKMKNEPQYIWYNNEKSNTQY